MEFYSEGNSSIEVITHWFRDYQGKIDHDQLVWASFYCSRPIGQEYFPNFCHNLEF